MSANFRALYTLNHNLNCKNQMNPDQLWPLSIDGETGANMSAEDMYSRNKRIIESMEKSGFMN